MSRFGFVGPSYRSQSVTADSQACVNFYVEADESGWGKSAAVLYPTPGLSVFSALTGTNVQGIEVINGRCFVVANSRLLELFADGTSTDRGDVTGGLGLVSIATSPVQLMVCTGGNLYCFNLLTNSFQTVQPLAQPNPIKVVYSDGYFIILFGNTQEIQISTLNDGTTWNGVDVAQVSVFPDNVVGMIVDHRELWLWGQKASQVYYNSGAADFPFTPIQGAYIEQGLAAVNSPVKVDNSVCWLGQDERGAGMGWRANAYTPQRVSNHAIEYAWSQYPIVTANGITSSVADAVSYSYQDQGHAFWVLYFPTANKTWVFDSATGMWHERGFWQSGDYTAHRSQNHAFAFGKHLVGDWQTATVYDMSVDTTDDFGNPIRRVRRAPHVSSEQQWIQHAWMQVDLEVGLGLQVGQGSDPQVMLRWSDDGGQTWSNEHMASAGKAGRYKTRVIWRRLGRSRDRVYELSMSDPIPWRIADAYLNAEPGFQPQERLTKSLGKTA